MIKKAFCKIEVRHTLKRKKLPFNFFFSNDKLLPRNVYLIIKEDQKPDFLK